MCVCYSQPLHGKPELMYTVVLVHKGGYSVFFMILLFLLEHIIISSFSLCRLQQDIQSVSGRRPVASQSRTAPSALHPHRLFYTQQLESIHQA